MSNNPIRARKPDRVVHLEKVRLPDFEKHRVSRLRETGHVPYRCTRSYRTADGAERDQG